MTSRIGQAGKGRREASPSPKSRSENVSHLPLTSPTLLHDISLKPHSASNRRNNNTGSTTAQNPSQHNRLHPLGRRHPGSTTKQSSYASQEKPQNTLSFAQPERHPADPHIDQSFTSPQQNQKQPAADSHQTPEKTGIHPKPIKHIQWDTQSNQSTVLQPDKQHQQESPSSLQLVLRTTSQETRQSLVEPPQSSLTVPPQTSSPSSQPPTLPPILVEKFSSKPPPKPELQSLTNSVSQQRHTTSDLQTQNLPELPTDLTDQAGWIYGALGFTPKVTQITSPYSPIKFQQFGSFATRYFPESAKLENDGRVVLPGEKYVSTALSIPEEMRKRSPASQPYPISFQMPYIVPKSKDQKATVNANALETFDPLRSHMAYFGRLKRSGDGKKRGRLGRTTTKTMDNSVGLEHLFPTKTDKSDGSDSEEDYSIANCCFAPTCCEPPNMFAAGSEMWTPRILEGRELPRDSRGRSIRRFTFKSDGGNQVSLYVNRSILGTSDQKTKNKKYRRPKDTIQEKRIKRGRGLKNEPHTPCRNLPPEAPWRYTTAAIHRSTDMLKRRRENQHQLFASRMICYPAWSVLRMCDASGCLARCCHYPSGEQLRDFASELHYDEKGRRLTEFDGMERADLALQGLLPCVTLNCLFPSLMQEEPSVETQEGELVLSGPPSP